jgi:hypothetical protein
MKRTLAMLAVSAAVVAGVAWPAAAKGEGPVGATITGPGIGGPGGSGGPGMPGGPGSGGSGGSDEGSGTGGSGGMAVGTIELRDRSFAGFQNTPIWRLATFSGAVPNCSACFSFIDTTPPSDRASLGPAYRVTYFAGRCCQHATTQFLYPYAPGGPWAQTLAGPPRDFFLGEQRAGWWHADGRMGQLFVRFLHHIGIPQHDPMAAAAAKPAPAPTSQPQAAAAVEATSSGGSAPWRLPVAIAAMVALLALGAIAARPRSSTRPA